MAHGYKGGGRRTTLTKRLTDDLLDLVAAGNSIATSAAACHVPESTLYGWLARARDADTLLAADPDAHLTDAQRTYSEFAERLRNARARGEVELVNTVHEVIKGGQLVEEEPLVDHRGNLVTNADGEVMYRRRWAPADGRLAMKVLAVTRPAEWGEKRQVELTGPDGTPVQINTTVVVALAERVAEFRREREQDDETLVGEVVEPGEVEGPTRP
jgi:hypothetical protein